MTQLSLLLFSFCAFATADSVVDLDQRLTDLERAAKTAQSAGDNAWIFTRAAPLSMTTGRRLFCRGLVRAKKVLKPDQASLCAASRLQPVVRACARGTWIILKVCGAGFQ
jgi:hypothetical protein